MKDLTRNKRDIMIGLVILVVIAGLVYWFKLRKPTPTVPVSTTPSIEQVEGTIEDKFKFTVPDNVEKALLKDITGGDGSGIATRTEILVDLPDSEPGTYYQAWLENANGKLLSLGKLEIAKGGWLVRYNGASYPTYNKVVISQEKVVDGAIEERVLEGSF